MDPQFLQKQQLGLIFQNFKVWAANVTLFACKSSSARQSTTSDGVMVQGVFEGLTCADGDRMGKAKEKKGEAVKVWKCVEVGESDGEEEDRLAKRPRLGPGIGKPSLSGTASEPLTGTAGEPSTGTAGKPSTTTGPGIRKPSPLPVPAKSLKKAVPKHPQSWHPSGRLVGQGMYTGDVQMQRIQYGS